MTRQELLDAAAAAVMRGREQDYGSPEDSFQLIAHFWNIYLNERVAEGYIGLEPFDVALMMDLLKTARLIRTEGLHLDSWIDKAGYAACGAECIYPAAPVEPEEFTAANTEPEAPCDMENQRG